MWNLFQRYQQRAIVGTAVTLVMLALLARGHRAALHTMIAAGPPISNHLKLIAVHRDPTFYSAQWQQIANEFYANHPVDSAKPTAQVITASLTDQVASNEVSNRENRVTTASHIANHSNIEKSLVAIAPATPITAATKRIAMIGPPAVFAALAAGVLAWMLYGTVWPSVPKLENHSLECTGMLRLELPRNWVTVRLSVRERIKPIVLISAGVCGSLATWSIIV